MCELGWFVCLFCFLNARFAWDKDYTPLSVSYFPRTCMYKIKILLSMQLQRNRFTNKESYFSSNAGVDSGYNNP